MDMTTQDIALINPWIKQLVEWAKFFMQNPFEMKNKTPARVEYDSNPSILGINVEVLGEATTMHMLTKSDTQIAKFMAEVGKMYFTNFVDTEDDSIKDKSKSKSDWKSECKCAFIRKKGGGQLLKQYKIGQVLNEGEWVEARIDCAQKKNKVWNQTPEFNLSYLSPMRVDIEELNLNSVGKSANQSIDKFEPIMAQTESVRDNGLGSQRDVGSLQPHDSAAQDLTLKTFFSKFSGDLPRTTEFSNFGMKDPVQNLMKSSPPLPKLPVPKNKKINNSKTTNGTPKPEEVLKKRQPLVDAKKDPTQLPKKKLETEAGNTKKPKAAPKKNIVDKVSELGSNLDPSVLFNATKIRKESLTSNLSEFGLEKKRKGSTQTTPKIGATSEKKFLEPENLQKSSKVPKTSKKKTNPKVNLDKANSSLGEVNPAPQSPKKAERLLSKSLIVESPKKLKFQSPNHLNVMEAELVNFPAQNNFPTQNNTATKNNDGQISANDTPFKSIINNSIHTSDFDESSNSIEAKKPVKVDPHVKKNSTEVAPQKKPNGEKLQPASKKDSGFTKNGNKLEVKSDPKKKQPKETKKMELNGKVKNKNVKKNLVKNVSDESSGKDSSVDESPETHYDFDKRLLPHIATPKSTSSSFSSSSEEVKKNKETSSQKPNSNKGPSYMQIKNKNSHRFSIITPKSNSQKSIPVNPQNTTQNATQEPTKKVVVKKAKESSSEYSSDDDSSVDSHAKKVIKLQKMSKAKEESPAKKKVKKDSGKGKKVLSSGSEDTSDSEDDDKDSSNSKDKREFKKFDKSKSIFNKNKNRILNKFKKSGEKAQGL